jgi:outer membrane receptor protein involved in Fe transport
MSALLLVVAFPLMLLQSEKQDSPLPPPQNGAAGQAPKKGDAAAQTPVATAPETVVTATRQEENLFDVPRSMNVVGAEELRRKNPYSPIDALDDQVGVFTTRRNTTSNDPIIRGLSGRNILALYDLNTVSTLWGEGGDDQSDMYGKIDPETVERIEVIRGPSSVLYGSNALGGVVNMLPARSPFGFTDDGALFGSRTHLTYGSAAQEVGVREEVYGATPDVRFLAGYTLRRVDDTTGGRGEGILSPTSGEMTNLNLAGDYRLTETQSFALDLTRTRLHDTFRYHWPQQRNDADRDAAALKWRNDAPTSLYDSFEWRFYWQRKEDRRSFLDTDELGKAKWRTYASDLQLTAKPLSDHVITYGAHYEMTRAQSGDDEQFDIYHQDGSVTSGSPNTAWQNLGVYAQDEWRFSNPFELIFAVRGDAFLFQSHVDQNYHPPGEPDPTIDNITARETAPTGGVALLYHATEEVNLYTNYSRGFRMNAPNFGVTQQGDGVLVPNPFLNPIHADNVEVGMKSEAPRFRSTCDAFYSWYSDFQSFNPGTFQGQDWFDFNGNGVQDPGENVLVVTGNGRAVDYGVEGIAEARLDLLNDLCHADLFGPSWWLRAGGAWEMGIDHGQDQPLRLVHAPYAIAGLRWQPPDPENPHHFHVDLDGLFVARNTRIPRADYADDPAFLKNPQDRTSAPLRADGEVPGYGLLNLFIGFDVNERVQVGLNLQNLTDRQYRAAYNRVDGTGINAILSLTVRL